MPPPPVVALALANAKPLEITELFPLPPPVAVTVTAPVDALILIPEPATILVTTLVNPPPLPRCVPVTVPEILALPAVKLPV